MVSTAMLTPELERSVAGYDQRARRFYRAAAALLANNETPGIPTMWHLFSYLRVAGSSMTRLVDHEAWLTQYQEAMPDIVQIGDEMLRAGASLAEMSDATTATLAIQRTTSVLRHRGLGYYEVFRRRDELLRRSRDQWKPKCDSYGAIFSWCRVVQSLSMSQHAFDVDSHRTYVKSSDSTFDVWILRDGGGSRVSRPFRLPATTRPRQHETRREERRASWALSHAPQGVELPSLRTMNASASLPSVSQRT